MLMRTSTLTALPLFLLACGGTTGNDTGAATPSTDPEPTEETDTVIDTGTPPTGYVDAYSFESRFDDADSVSYGGQTFRQVLIGDMKTHLGGLTDRINTGFFPAPGDVDAELDFYFSFDSTTSGTVPHLVSTDPAALQQTYDDLGSDKDLVGKIAGNDSTGQHRDWSTEFVGWNAAGVDTPESLVRHWFDEIDSAAVAWASGTIPLDPAGNPVPEVYVTADGLDLRQLLEKFLRGAVSFSQGTDDYMDDDIADKGLLSAHADAEDGKNYSALEHAWDEAFGYFGAARSYPDWTDDQIADDTYLDMNADSAIDLGKEMCFGHSLNAAKRDRGAVAATDFTADAWEGFYEGRALLAASDGELSTEDLAELQVWRDQAVLAWESAISSTVIHYINDVLQDMAAMDDGTYDFGTHAKHWSEMKGFALSFQFNPRSPMSQADLATLHDLLGDRPVLSDASPAAIDAHADDLRTARGLIGDAYGFDAANLGDADGLGGW